MRKTLALLLLVSSIFALVSCGGSDYPPVKSTELESSVVMTMKIEDDVYNVKYELYRALFLNHRDQIDGGDLSVWSGDNKDEYIAKIEDIITKRVSDIYGVIHTAKKIGIDIYSDEFNDAIDTYIEVSVEGGYYNDLLVEGFDGDYDAYLASLKEMNLNYSVQDLLLRYSLATEKIFEYYAGDMSSDFVEEIVPGELEYTKDDVKAFYKSDNCVRVIRAYLPKRYFTETRAQQIRQRMVELEDQYGQDAVANYIISLSATAGKEVKNGEIIGKHNLDSVYYEQLIDAAFSLDYFEVSGVLEISTGFEEGYAILYKIYKDDSTHFEECYNDIASVYVQNETGRITDANSDELMASIEKTSFLNSLNRANISMQ